MCLCINEKCVYMVLNGLHSYPISVKTANHMILLINLGVFVLFSGGKPKALPYTIPRRAEEHGEDSPVCGPQAEGG